MILIHRSITGKKIEIRQVKLFPSVMSKVRTDNLNEGILLAANRAYFRLSKFIQIYEEDCALKVYKSDLYGKSRLVIHSVQRCRMSRRHEFLTNSWRR